MTKVPGVALALAAAVVVSSSPAWALDCAHASQTVDKLICTTPELKKADEAMSAAYFKLLKATTDQDFHEALIRSQRRWLTARSHGLDRFGQAEGDTTDDREVLLGLTRDRLDSLRTGELIRRMEEQRATASKDGGGPFSGYKTYCIVLPPPYGSWGYSCWGDAHRQHNGRICSSAVEWASGHLTEVRLVSILRDNTPKPLASCSTGYASTNEQCPDPDNDAEQKAVAHWNTNPAPSDHVPRAEKLWKYDPDASPDAADVDWMRECVSAPTYPPTEASRPDPTPAVK